MTEMLRWSAPCGREPQAIVYFLCLVSNIKFQTDSAIRRLLVLRLAVLPVFLLSTVDSAGHIPKPDDVNGSNTEDDLILEEAEEEEQAQSWAIPVHCRSLPVRDWRCSKFME
jgi:hypothetical protein